MSMEGNEQVRKLPKSFGFFNATQFLGALNDNLFKLLVIYYLIGLQGADAKINNRPFLENGTRCIHMDRKP